MQASAIQNTSSALTTISQSAAGRGSQQLVATSNQTNSPPQRLQLPTKLVSNQTEAKSYNPNTPRGSYVNLLV